MKGVNRDKGFDKLFDTIVSAERVEYGKPNPECYLLAAKDLNVKPENCIVFEDSFAGIEAGNAAGMVVVGLATTNPANMLEDKTVKVIPDFSDFSIADLEAIGQ